MIAKANMKIGGVAYQFEISEAEELKTLHKIIALSNPRSKCNVCGNSNRDDMQMSSNIATGKKGTFTYIKIFCKCGAQSTLGKYQADGYFWKEFEVYRAGENEEDQV